MFEFELEHNMLYLSGEKNVFADLRSENSLLLIVKRWYWLSLLVPQSQTVSLRSHLQKELHTNILIYYILIYYILYSIVYILISSTFEIYFSMFANGFRLEMATVPCCADGQITSGSCLLACMSEKKLVPNLLLQFYSCMISRMISARYARQ